MVDHAHGAEDVDVEHLLHLSDVGVDARHRVA